MSRTIGDQCASCRTAGEKLFLKGDRCAGPKCAIVRRSDPPGVHGKARKSRKVSGYGKQLREKQEAKSVYGLRERQFSNYVREASRKTGDTSKFLLTYLESRLDNVIYRMGLANSRPAARQMVGHGHIEVNGKKVDIPSFQVKVGDVAGLRELKKTKALHQNISDRLSKVEAPAWMSVDAKKASSKILNTPIIENPSFNAKSIIEFYSR